MYARYTRLGLLLPSPYAVASPVRAVHLVSELAGSVAYLHEASEVLLESGWWSRRICGKALGGARCSEVNNVEQVVAESDKILEALVDGVKPPIPLGRSTGRPLLSYYVDSRRGSVLFLGAKRVFPRA